MYIQSIENQELLGEYEIIELKVRGNEEQLNKFMMDIQDFFDLAHNDWESSLNMLILTFDKKPKEQTLNMIKSYTKDYIEKINNKKTINS